MTVEQGFSALNPTEMRFLLKRESEACIYIRVLVFPGGSGSVENLT